MIEGSPGTISHTKVYSNIGYITLTGTFISFAWRNMMTIEYFVAYALLVAVPAGYRAYLALKGAKASDAQEVSVDNKPIPSRAD